MSSDYLTWGIQENGAVIPTAAEIKESLENDQRSIVLSNLDISASSPIGQINGVFAPQLARAWEALGVLEASRSRDGAEAMMLDEHGILTGSNREQARPTTVICTCNLDAGTKLTRDSLAYLKGRPDVTFYAYVDETVGFTAPTTGNYSIVFKCTVTGPVIVSAHTVTGITTTTSGWNSIDNALPGTTGTDVASDYATRLAQEASLAITGSATAAAIAADIQYNEQTGEGIPGCIRAYVIENDTGNTVNGQSAHTIECVLYTDGTSDPAVIAEKIFKAKTAGRGTYGSLSADYIDSNGDSHRVNYSVITAIEIYMKYQISITGNYIGDDAMKDAIVTEMTARASQGTDVNYAYARGIPMHYAGVVDSISLRIGDDSYDSGMFEANFSISDRQLAVFDKARITITHV